MKYLGTINDDKSFITREYVQDNAYTLPVASDSTLGGVKVGEGLSIEDGVLSAGALGTMSSVEVTPDGTARLVRSTDLSPVVGENGDWYVNGEDTGVRAEGPQGQPGSDASVTSANIEMALGFSPASHVIRHATGGADALTPAAIGAIPSTEKAASNGIATLNEAGKLVAEQASATLYGYETDITLGLSHAGKFIWIGAGSNLTVTIPAYSSVPYPDNTELEIVQSTNNPITIVGASGVNILSMGGAVTTAGQYAAVGLKMIAHDLWLLTGALA